MIRGVSTARFRRLLPLSCGVLLLALLLAPAAFAAGDASSPITWSPAASTYGSPGTAFMPAPPPAPPGIGTTGMVPPMAIGAGFWDGMNEVYAMGFINSQQTDIFKDDSSCYYIILKPLGG